MINTTPNLTIKLSGKGNVTEFETTKLFTVKEKLEQNFVLNEPDGVTNINYSTVENLGYMLFSSDSDFELTITTAIETLEMTTNLFVLTPSTTFASSITGITIKALSPDVKQTIAVRLYGA